MSALLAPVLLALAAPQEDAGALVARGRELLAAERPVEAEALFERASALAPGLATRLWVLRAWMDQGRVNDALGGADALRAEGGAGPELDYLYGMAWFRAAEAKIDGASFGPELTRNLESALAHLEAADAARDERFGDALYPLAKVAWMLARPETAAAAAARACERSPSDPRAWHLRGRVARERFAVARADPSGAERSGALAEEALTSLERAAELLGEPGDAAREALAAETALQLTELHLARGEPERAAAALERAVERSPDRADYAALRALLPPDAFTGALARGAAAREARGLPAAAPRWWQGYAELDRGRLPEAERAFLAAAGTERDDVQSAWYWIARTRWLRRDADGASAALRLYWERDATDLLARLEPDRERNAAMLDELGRRAADRGRLDEATLLLELHAELVATPGAWQRLARLLLAAGEAMGEADAAGAARCRQAARYAFERAATLAPSEPVHLDDLARSLLDDDPARAGELWARAERELVRRLADPALGPPARAVLEALLGSARDGLREVRRRAESGR